MLQITNGVAGFETTSGITFWKYTSTPIRPLRLPGQPGLSQAVREGIDWSLSFDVPRSRLSRGGSVMWNEDLEAVREQLQPAAHLDLSQLAAIGLLPTPYSKSYPDIGYDLQPNTTPIEIAAGANEAIVQSIHDAFYRTILPNIHYAHRLRQFFRRWGMIQVHLDNETDLVPHLTDDAACGLLINLNARACRKLWCRVEMFSDSRNKSKFGLGAWLWGEREEIAKQRANNQAHLSTGSVLFVHIPFWVMPEEEVLRELQSMRTEGFMTAPKWFPSVHTTCENYGAHHFVIFTGELVIIGIFSADFTDISFSTPERVDVGRNGYGTGIGPDGLERIPLDKQRICLVQVISQLMMDAEESQGATSPQPTGPTFRFGVAPLAWNEHPVAASSEPAEAMRFSRRPVGPSQQEINAALKAYREDRAKKGKGKAVVVAAARESALALSAQPLASGSQSAALGSPSRKRQRPEEEQLKLPAPPIPVAEPSTVSHHSGRPGPSTRPAAGSAVRRMSVKKTKYLDAEVAGDFRPSKRTKLAITERAVSPPASPAPAKPAAGPSEPRRSTRAAKLAEVADAKKRTDIKEKARAISSRPKRQVAQSAAPVAAPSTSRQTAARNAKLAKAADSKKRSGIKGKAKAASSRSERQHVLDQAVGDVDVDRQEEDGEEEEEEEEPVFATEDGKRYSRRLHDKVTVDAAEPRAQGMSGGRPSRKVGKPGTAVHKAKQPRIRPAPRLPTRRSDRIALLEENAGIAVRPVAGGRVTRRSARA
ncbi:hypothetical protein FRB94_010382 [Tulasnella sp. JGI-2019a]|nr:hypothetical protein FRB93_006453 [Tulasnella sp. JGI-2019a]KAG8993783.1 hypothetical protein FRB94_010382 [Tulasnella sp. JGI-2019a]